MIIVIVFLFIVFHRFSSIIHRFFIVFHRLFIDYSLIIHRSFIDHSSIIHSGGLRRPPVFWQPFGLLKESILIYWGSFVTTANC